jgi:hypothetical protein
MQHRAAARVVAAATAAAPESCEGILASAGGGAEEDALAARVWAAGEAALAQAALSQDCVPRAQSGC